jgi:hypothetical protein
VNVPPPTTKPTVDEQLSEIRNLLAEILDRLNRSRQHPFGERHPRALMSESQVLEARALKRTTDLSVAAIRARLSLRASPSAVRAAIVGDSWSYLNQPTT